jgi:hypothetical protein
MLIGRGGESNLNYAFILFCIRSAIRGAIIYSGGFGGADYVLSGGHIPKQILESQTPPEQAAGFVVIDSPDIFLKLPDRKLN